MVFRKLVVLDAFCFAFVDDSQELAPQWPLCLFCRVRGHLTQRICPEMVAIVARCDLAELRRVEQRPCDVVIQRTFREGTPFEQVIG